MNLRIHILFFVIIVFLFSSCTNKNLDYTSKVNVFIGTAGDGHTYPGASTPFGGVQLSPDTRSEGQESCGGYYYPDTTILGFTHTHLSGVGEPEYRDILFMPLSSSDDKTRLLKGDGFSYKHENEVAEPGYYSVLFSNNIRAELTATERCGFHKYTFPENGDASVFIDLFHPGGAEELVIKKVNDFEIEGLRRSHGWAYNQYVYFAAHFSEPVTSLKIVTRKDNFAEADSASSNYLKAILNFGDKKELKVKVGISAVSFEGARKNLEAEIPDWNFVSIRKQTRHKWNKELSKIKIEGGTKEQQTIFYTSMYHSFLSPDIFHDVDNRYRGIDGEIHKAEGFTNFTVFSLWDTYRALHPLFNIIQQEKNRDFIKSLLAKHDNGGRLPMWPLAGNYTDDMLGYHAVSVITDAYIKGLDGFNTSNALNAMKEIAGLDRLGLKYYKKPGYIPFDREGESVSKTLEYCYDDWCIAQFAKRIGNEDDYNTYHNRAHYYKNLFDRETNFFRGKDSERNWLKPFNPLINSAYSEGNAYQYLYAPHDVDGLIKLMGGDEKFGKWLDNLFTLTTEKDQSGSIGQYWHGNEPSHHLPYLYSYVGQPWKTQKYVNQILTKLYSNSPDGLAGNEDCGQMSAWYILSSLGFYPVTPGQDIYIIGTPLFPKATINLENGNKFIIEAKNLDSKNIYIQSARLNRKEYNKSYIKHSDIVNGGQLIFEMGPEPNKNRSNKKEDRPYSVNGNNVVANPYIKSGDILFKQFTNVELACDTKGAKIYYTLDGSEPDVDSETYTGNIEISESTVLKFFASKEDLENSTIVEYRLTKADYSKPARINQLTNGLSYNYFEHFFVTTDDLEKEQPLKTGLIDNFTIKSAKRDKYFGYIFKGYIKVSVTDIYTFYLQSNDGSKLFINDIEVIENDGNHGAIEEVGQVALKAGFHKIKVKYMQCGGGKDLKVSWAGSQFSKREIRGSQLYHNQQN
ncbi:MAG: GH92 family glycosyl hydrolase [Bacteroidota bacterium]